MQVSMEKTGDLERRMTVQIPATEIDSQVSSRLNELRREVRLKGFRPGKVPLEVVRQRYGKQVREEVLGQVMQDRLQQAVGEKKLRVAGVTRLQPAVEAIDGQFEFIAELEVFPEVPEIQVDSFEFERPVAEVLESDIDDMIETLREQRRSWHPVDRPAGDGDRVRVSYLAEFDGQRVPQSGRHEIAPVLGQLDGFAELEGMLAGVSAGDEKNAMLNFPAGYRDEQLAGRTASVEMQIKAVEESELPEVDDDFAAAFGVDGGVEQLRRDVRRNLERELRQAITNRLKKAVTEHLLEHYGHLALPASSVDQEARQMLAQLRGQSAQEAASLSIEQVRGPAERRLRLGLLFGEFARQNQIEVDADRVQSKLEEIAETYENPSEIIQLYRSDGQLIDQVESSVLEEQVIDKILERASIQPREMSFKEVMAPQ